MSPDDPRHGTNAGYKAHQKSNTTPCRLCRDAAARYVRGREWDALQGRPRWMSPLGAQRRLQALSAIGYPIADLTRETGMSQDPVQKIRAGDRQRITRRSHDRIAAAFGRLSMTPGPSNSARLRAAARGWLPPLVWDDPDDPAETPKGARPRTEGRGKTVDPVVVEEVLMGRDVPTNPAERAEVIRRWRKSSRSLMELERRTGWNVHRYPGRDEREAS